MQINVYLKDFDKSSLEIASGLRNSYGVQIWMCKSCLQSSQSEYIQIIRHWKNIAFVDENHKLDNGICDFEWKMEKHNANILNCGLRYVNSRFKKDKTKFCIISSEEHPNNILIMFRDSKNDKNLPDEFIKIPCFKSLPDIIKCCNFTFLENQDRFQVTKPTIKGAMVYKERSTGHYWYLDTLHKNHYEVFDSTGRNHLGEADLAGNIDETKRDNNKRIRS